MLKNMFYIVLCHLFGDYVLQCDFIAKSKGSNWYHLFVHCALYLMPFAVVFGVDWRIVALFLTHIIVDAGKARYNVVSYTEDQIFHYCIAALLYI